jgi:Spy/CpxP family protein refolding chaperone
MKSFKNKMVSMLVLLFLVGAAVNAQPSGDRVHGLAGLSDDQKAQIHKLRISHLKDIQTLQNQIRENRAHYKTLMTSENPDMSAINKNIDEFGSFRNQLMKKQAAHIQDVRKILNDEQRLMFDNKLEQRAQMSERRGMKGHGWRMGKPGHDTHSNMNEGQK